MDYIKWIRSGLKKPGKSQAGLARKLGIDRSQITKMLDDKREIKASELSKISEYLEEAEPTGVSASHLSTQIPRAKYMGTIGLNAWVDKGHLFLDDSTVIPAHPDARYPPDIQSYFKLLVGSTDGELRSGDYLITVPFSRFRGQPIVNDLIVCRRTRRGMEQSVLRRALEGSKAPSLEPLLEGDAGASDPVDEVASFLVIALHRPMG